MCFYNEYDDGHDFYESSRLPMGRPTACDECGSQIGYGDWRYHVHTEEYEECSKCGFGRDDDPNEDLEEGEEPTHCEHDYGNSWDYDRCLACDKILRAIEAHEKDEGCPPDNRRPYLTGLWEAMHDHEGGEAYRARARQMFPEIAGHKFLA